MKVFDLDNMVWCEADPLPCDPLPPLPPSPIVGAAEWLASDAFRTPHFVVRVLNRLGSISVYRIHREPPKPSGDGCQPVHLHNLTNAERFELLDGREEAAFQKSKDPMNSLPCSLDPFTGSPENIVKLLARDLPRPKMLTVRSPAELVDMTFGDDDIILGDRLLAEGQSLVIAAAGGTGKSRLLLQFAASVVAGLDFIGLPTAGEEKRWLILQTENSNRRLQADLLNLMRWLDVDEWAAFSERVGIHTVEGPDDGFVSLDSPHNLALIEATIQECQPDVIAIDPLNEFAIGDLNKDADMRATLSTLTQLCRRGNPKRAIVVLHHALTGRAGAAKAIGYDRASFGRNSKNLHAWARGQINLAPANPDDNRQLVVSCGKTSNGREFQPFAIAMSDEGIYEPDASVDIKAWASDMAGTARNAPLMPPERVAELCTRPMEKAELAAVVREDCGCVKASAYRYIKKAESARLLKFNPNTKHFTRK